MRVVSLLVRNVRCFSSLELDFDRSVVLIVGPNGSGKTTLLEALHYACYLRSFKTHLPREIVQQKAEGFAIQLGILSDKGFDSLGIQFSKNKKTVKLNEQPVHSFKELYTAYRAVTITEDDLMMVQGAPSLRRSFMDYVVLLFNPDFTKLSKKYKTVLDNRNALLVSQKNDNESYCLWTEQLLELSHQIQAQRIEAIKRLEYEAIELYTRIQNVNNQFPHMTESQINATESQVSEVAFNSKHFSLKYEFARPYSTIEDIKSCEQLLERYPNLQSHEKTMKRTLFGAHLDDLQITFQGKNARTYASRGQQKLIVFLLKLAQIKALNAPSVLLVDDFLTDFDEKRINALLPLMTELPSQVILTSPIEAFLKEALSPYNAQIIKLE